MRSLYPLAEPFVQHSIDVGDGHVLHAAEYGRPDGLPAIVLHGGPGAGSASWQARLFDPDVYRIILFDQRGCGRSTPHGALHANTTDHLIDDIERIREHLAIRRWLVLGGSWGATLGILYAARYPERICALVTRGAFLARQRDIDWLYGDGARRLLPEAWQDFLAPLSDTDRADPIAAYHRRLFGRDDIARMAAAKAWAQWEGRVSTLRPNADVMAHYARPSVALSLARIECHYFVNHCWLDDGDLLRQARRLAGVDGTIVHGRYDLVCPVEQASELAAAWPGSERAIVDDAGHAGLEPGIVDAVVRATDRYADALFRGSPA